MADELNFRGANRIAEGDRLGESLESLIRDAYSPPDGERYWDSHEARIMTQGSGDSSREVPWWNVLAPWIRPAIVAAAAIFALAGIVNQKIGESEAQVSYDSVIQATTPDVVATSEELISVERGTDGATLNYFLSH
jgi:hypothetical protein